MRLFNNRNILSFVCAALFLFGNLNSLTANEILTIDNPQKVYPLIDSISILEDSSGNLSIADILQDEYASKFTDYTETNLNLGYSNSSFWLKLDVKNISEEQSSWLIQQNYSNTHFMEVYAEGDNYFKQISGSLVPLSQRSVNRHDIVFKLNLPANIVQTIYFRIRTLSSVSLDIQLLTEQKLESSNDVIQLAHGVFYGIMLIMAVYNLFFYFSLKDKSYLFLTLFITSCTSVYVLFDGFAYRIFSSNILPDSAFLFPMLMGLTCLAILFHWQLLLHNNTKLIKQVHTSLLIAWFIVVLSSPVINTVISMHTSILLVLLTVIYVFSTTVVCWRKHEPAARFALLGWLVFGGFMLLMSLARLQVIPDHFVYVPLSRVGLVILVLLLSIALIDRINRLKKQGESNQSTLEKTVMQRNLALEAGHLGIWRWKSTENDVYWSDRTCQIFGVSPGFKPNGFAEYREFIHPEDLPIIENTISEAIEKRQSYSFQHRIIQKSGNEVWAQCFGKLEFDTDDNFTGSIGTIQDITEQKKLELEKQQSQKLYEDIFSSASEGFVIRTLDGKTLDANPAIYNLYGYTKDEYFALRLEQIVHPDSINELQRFREAINKKHAYFGEAKRIRKDGKVIDVEIHASIIDYKGQPCVFSIVHDISERKQIETIIREIAEGVSSSTGDAFLQQLVKQVAKLFGAKYAFISMIDNNHPKILSTSALCVDGEVVENISYEREHTPCAEVLSKDSCAYSENIQSLFPKDKLLVDMQAESYIGTPLFDSEKNPIGLIVIIDTKSLNNIEQIKEIMQIFAARCSSELERMRALNELKLHQEQLEEKVKLRTAELEAVNLELESFSYSVSHDLRSPLRAIDGFSNVLMDEYEDKLEGEALDLLTRVRKNTQRMGKLIDDLLNLSHLGRKQLKRSKCNLGNTANEIVANLREIHPHHNVKFICNVSDTISADAELIKIALENLLSNAWKYTSKKEIPVVEFGKEIQDGKPVYFIKDNGAGFDMAYADKLFGAFQRLHGREFEGSGIGLATVQRIFLRHHGVIWADAKVNEGATFYFTFE